MSSGQVYFWHMETNEVVWDPPEGSKPRRVEGIALASAQASDDFQATPDSTPPFPVRDSAAADVHMEVKDEEDKHVSTAEKQPPDSDHAVGDSLNHVQEVRPAACPGLNEWRDVSRICMAFGRTTRAWFCGSFSAKHWSKRRCCACLLF